MSEIDEPNKSKYGVAFRPGDAYNGCTETAGEPGRKTDRP